MVKRGLPFYLLTFLPLIASAQDKIVNPDISYAGTPRTCEIAGIAVKGVEGYEDYVLTGLSGLSVASRSKSQALRLQKPLSATGATDSSQRSVSQPTL